MNGFVRKYGMMRYVNCYRLVHPCQVFDSTDGSHRAVRSLALHLRARELKGGSIR